MEENGKKQEHRMTVVETKQHILEKSVHSLRNFLIKDCQNIDWLITIGDNASTDNTLAVATGLEKRFEDVRVFHLPRKGRGRMVKYAWTRSDADILSYMDIDLSTDLSAFPPMIQAIIDGYDIAIGSRQFKGAAVDRSIKREIVSRGYIWVLKLFLGFPFTDAQCGFKAASKKAVSDLFPTIEDDEWFFDTELLYIAHKEEYKVKELPVRWIEDRDSRVKILRTAWLDIKGVFRMIGYRKGSLK